MVLAYPVGLTVIMGLFYCLESSPLSCTFVFVLIFACLSCSLLSVLGVASIEQSHSSQA